MKEPFELKAGAVVVSRMGRDKGSAYVVLSFLSEERVLVADGRKRPTDHPKQKNVKHLAVKPCRITAPAGNGYTDEEIRCALLQSGYLET